MQKVLKTNNNYGNDMKHSQTTQDCCMSTDNIIKKLCKDGERKKNIEIVDLNQKVM